MQKPDPAPLYHGERQPSLSYRLLKIWNPSWFQGRLGKKDYFEGWYLKVVSADGRHSWAFIPGLSLNGNDSHSFVQAINGKTGQTWYFRYPVEDFRFSDRGFSVGLGPNAFSRKGMNLDLQNERGFFRGKLDFGTFTRFPVSFRRPGIMGWYRYVPFMECYHGVVSLDHQVNGEIACPEGLINLDQGRGYIEKDWGTSMPEAWIWMQTNHFDQTGTSFMLSVAKIPWIGKSFTGFLGFFHFQGKLFPFATYTGAKIGSITEQGPKLRVEIRARTFRMEIEALRGEKGSLKAPVAGGMERIIHESIDSSLWVTLFDKQDQILYTGQGINAGLELVGDLSILT